MNAEAPVAIHRADYRPTPYAIGKVELEFDLEPEATVVTAAVSFTARPGGGGELKLNGEKLELLSIAIDGRPLKPLARLVAPWSPAFAHALWRLKRARTVEVSRWSDREWRELEALEAASDEARTQWLSES